jgi:GrpB-like predicted nucleotidyltransferase (UPF0157 family)
MAAKEPVVVVDYDPTWPGVFVALRDRVAVALGDLAVAIEHVGSTSVPGLAAKPIIDMDVVVATPREIPLGIERLATIGYVHQGDLGIAGREAFQSASGRRHNLYLCARDSEELRRHLLFRDYLRAHSDEVRAYAELKRGLAQRFRDDRDSYTEGKTTFVCEVLRRAGA